MASLELKIPPPVVTACFAVLMWIVSRLVPWVELPLALRAGIATVLAATGLAIAIAGVASFRRAKTTVNPTTPSAASTLVRGGIYRVTRNPMYLGLALCLLAWAGFLSNVLALLLVPLFVGYMNRFQIHPEERALQQLFGDDYAAYKQAVRRWL